MKRDRWRFKLTAANGYSIRRAIPNTPKERAEDTGYVTTPAGIVGVYQGWLGEREGWVSCFTVVDPRTSDEYSQRDVTESKRRTQRGLAIVAHQFARAVRRAPVDGLKGLRS